MYSRALHGLGGPARPGPLRSWPGLKISSRNRAGPGRFA